MSAKLPEGCTITSMSACFVDEHPYPILRISGDGRILFANPASLPVLLEWGTEAGGTAKPEAAAIAREVLSSGVSVIQEVSFGGTSLELLFCPSRSGSFVNVFGHDVSAQKAARTELEAAMKARSDFLASVSHELRTPMNGVIGMCELLLQEHQDKALEERLRVIQRSGAALLEIVNDLLDLSKLEAGKMDVEIRPFEVRVVVEEAVALLRALKPELAISCTLEASVPRFIEGDAGRLRQVLLNLGGNAVKFTESGSVSIAVAANEAMILEFSVTDTGPGIPEEARGKIFEAFSQASSSVAGRFGGTGLGLAISKRLCERMGGTLWFESTEGVGSVFRFTIRGARAEAAAKLEAPARTRRLRVLVAEDNEVNRLVVTGMLEKMGHHFTVACDGVEAVRAALGAPFDVILMDCQMPGKDGPQAAREILAVKAGIPVVALTASAMEEDVQRCRASGMAGFLSKPVSFRSLAKALADHAPAGAVGAVGAPGSEAPSAPPVRSALDKKALLAHFEGDSEILNRMITAYLGGFPELIGRVEGAVEARNGDEIRRSAHTLKGCLANLFAGKAVLLAEGLERRARERKLWGLRRRWFLLKKECERVNEEIRAMAAPGAGAPGAAVPGAA